MKEFQQILAALETTDDAILATVVDVEGSGYRRPGARMLIGRDGYAIGTVSGGCLEADVLERAKKVVETGEPTIIRYDTTKDEDSVFGLGMGCRGIVRILLEIVTKDSPIIEIIRNAVEKRKRTVIATVISGDDSGLRVYENDELLGEFKTSGAAFAIETVGGVEYFFENIAPPLMLFVFGAGHDALPLIRFAKEIGWQVTAIDHRPAFTIKERLGDADAIINKDPREFAADFPAGENQAAVIMTHNFERDREILPALLRANLTYVGALGPKTRTDKILAQYSFTEEELSVLHAPVGLDIGGDTPETIALSIVAEIQAAIKQRRGGHLRERNAPIYDRKRS